MRGNECAPGRWIKAVLMFVLVVQLQACGFPDDSDVWKDEVRLTNGELLVLDRLNRWGESGDLSLGHGPLTWAEIRFEYKGKKYSWGSRGLAPHALQLDPQGRFYIVTSIPYCWAWEERGKPDSFYVVFRYENDKWIEIPLAEIDVNTVFNLSGTSNIPLTKGKTKYQKETDWKYKDDTVKYMRSIVPDMKPSC